MISYDDARAAIGAACGSFIGYTEKGIVALNALEACDVPAEIALHATAVAMMPQAEAQLRSMRESYQYADSRSRSEGDALSRFRVVCNDLRHLCG